MPKEMIIVIVGLAALAIALLVFTTINLAKIRRLENTISNLTEAYVKDTHTLSDQVKELEYENKEQFKVINDLIEKHNLLCRSLKTAERKTKGEKKMKVFSVKKFEEEMKRKGFSQESINIIKLLWANECEGLTEKGVHEKGGFTCNAFMIEKVEKVKPTITLKEFWESKENLAIHCWNDKQAKVLLKKFDEMGKKWANGDSYLDDDEWYDYTERTCYSNGAVFARIKFYASVGTKIYEFKDIEDFKGIYASDGTPLKQSSVKAPILDDVEKAYLLGIIKPFRDRVEGICKLEGEKGYFIEIEVKDDCDINLPDFNKNSSMYKGMEVDKDYTLEKLGL